MDELSGTYRGREVGRDGEETSRQSNCAVRAALKELMASGTGLPSDCLGRWCCH